MDWLGNALICVGLWFIGNKKRWVFLFSVAGESAWIVYAMQEKLYSLAFICAVFAGLALRNYIKWGDERTDGEDIAAKEALEKLRALTDPHREEWSNFGGRCAICGRDEPYTYHVPESLWRKILPPQYWDSIVCAKCFDEQARHITFGVSTRLR